MNIGKVYVVLALALVAASCISIPTVTPTAEDGTMKVSTLAGSGTAGFANGPGSSARFNSPPGVAVDSSGNVYVADKHNPRILKVSADGTVTVSTLAGSGTEGHKDGPGSSAQFYKPAGVAVDSSGNVYVADAFNHRIRKVTEDGVVSTLAGSGTKGHKDGPGSSAQFYGPTGIAVDSRNGIVYVADTLNERIRKIVTSEDGTVTVSTLAGSGEEGFLDGPGSSAQFNNPLGVAVDSSGNVYVGDTYNLRIRKVTEDGVVSTLAGSGIEGYMDGPGSSAQFIGPWGVAVDSSGNVYVGDTFNFRIRKVTADGTVSTLAGSGTEGFLDGPGSSAQFNYPTGVAVDSSGNVYVTDVDNHCIRKVTADGTVSTLAGGGTAGFLDGPGSSAQFKKPFGVAVDSSGNVYVGDRNNNRIRKIEYR